MFVCMCVSVDLFMPVDEWAFMRVPQSGFTHVFCPLTGYLYPCGDSYSPVCVFLTWYWPC